MPGPSRAKSAPTPRRPKQQSYRVAAQSRVIEDLPLPSFDEDGKTHNVCRVRRPDPLEMVGAGLLDHFDSLTAIIQTEHFDRVDGKKAEDLTPEERQAQELAQLQALAKDPKALKGMLGLIDSLVAVTLVEPAASAPPEDDADREEGVLYADEIDLSDRFAILEYALGGVNSLRGFRS